jgi:hypothetical protein
MEDFANPWFVSVKVAFTCRSVRCYGFENGIQCSVAASQIDVPNNREGLPFPRLKLAPQRTAIDTYMMWLEGNLNNTLSDSHKAG